MIGFSIGTSAIRELDGLFSLNDLHDASGGAPKHRPGYFLANAQTGALIEEIEKAGIPAIRAKQRIGTYACRELVIAYAAWISPAFHLSVLRVFLAAAAPYKSEVPALPADPLKRLSRDDLSFTRRDADGTLLNWAVPEQDGSWHDGEDIGRQWFEEIVALARRHPEMAFDAMRFAGVRLVEYLNKGHEYGFFESMAKWALVGIHSSIGVKTCHTQIDPGDLPGIRRVLMNYRVRR